MDYSYLNQAAATFDTNCLQNGMDPTGLANMPCSYGDLTSCSQMSQAYRYTAAAASMARSYNPVGTAVGHGTAAMAGLHHATGPVSQCSVMGSRNHHQDVHRTSMFSTSMSMQCEFLLLLLFFFQIILSQILVQRICNKRRCVQKTKKKTCANPIK